jgi:hypothetical protein
MFKFKSYENFWNYLCTLQIIMLHKKSIQLSPILSKRAFWDISLHALDFSKHKKFIITRVFERGSDDDKLAILNYYGEELIISILKNSESLLPVARERAKDMFHLSDNDFACYKSNQPTASFSMY